MMVRPRSSQVSILARRALSVCLLTLGSLPCIAFGEQITIGVPYLSREINILSASGPDVTVAALIREAVTTSLIRLRESEGSSQSSPQAFDLDLSDSVQVSSNQHAWSFRVRRGAVFSSGQPVQPQDVVFSLNQCLKFSSIQFSISEVQIGLGRESPEFSMREHWIQVAAPESTRQEYTPSALAEVMVPFVATCPIFERDSALLFGRHYGDGSNFVGAGAFWLAGIDKGREVVLERVRVDGGFVPKVSIRSFKDGVHGLTALRTGTVDVLFVDDSQVLARAENDQTLLINECLGYKIVSRRGLSLGCRTHTRPHVGGQEAAKIGMPRSPLDVSKLKYLS